MDLYAPIVKHIIHPIWVLKDGEYFHPVLRALEKSQFITSENLIELQIKKLKEITIHAYETCAYYREIFKSHTIEPRDICTFEDFRKVPLLTKESIQINGDNMVSSLFNKKDLIPDKTGGSTGKPIHYFHDKQKRKVLKAAEVRHDRWAGQDIGDKIAAIWGHRGDLAGKDKIKARIRNALLSRKLILDASSVTEKEMMSFLNHLIRFQPAGYLGYANALYEMSLFIKNKGLSTPKSARSAISSAEVLHEHERRSIEEAFGVKVFDRYGCREFGPIASECTSHKGLHIAADCLYVEFLDDMQEPVRNGEHGNIVITDLYNFGMPFIRYKIEDVGVPLEGSCDCGIKLPRMDKIAGRVTDFIITPEGVRVSGAAVTIALIANIPGVAQAQFIQETLQFMRLKIVRGDDFNADSIQLLEQELPKYFGNTMVIENEFVDTIPKEPSGKYRFSICKLKDRETAIK